MGLVTNITERHEVPGDEGQWIEFRALSAHQLRKAARARQIDAAELLRAYGGDLMAAMRNTDTSALEAAAQDPLTNYDALTLLKLSIAGWSYNVPVKEGVEQLSEPTETWAAGVVLRLSGVIKESEDERGNAGLSSAAT